MNHNIKPSVPGVQINTDHYTPAKTKRFFRMPLGKKIIYGCEARGDFDKPYLTRYTLFSCKWFQVCLHIFHRSDHDDHHDHPWNFTTIILWNGYYEETPAPVRCGNCGKKMEHTGKRYLCWSYDCDEMTEPCKEVVQQKRIYPGMILRRKAAHRHRVVLRDGKKAVTLVIMGKYRKTWGFFTKEGWVRWKEYFVKNKC